MSILYLLGIIILGKLVAAQNAVLHRTMYTVGKDRIRGFPTRATAVGEQFEVKIDLKGKYQWYDSVQKADQLVHDGKLWLARDTYLKAMRMENMSTEHRFAIQISLVRLYIHLRDIDAANDALNVAMSIDDNPAIVAFYRGTVASIQGDLVEARKQFERAVEIEPSYTDALNSLASISLLTGREDDWRHYSTALLRERGRRLRDLGLTWPGARDDVSQSRVNRDTFWLVTHLLKLFSVDGVLSVLDSIILEMGTSSDTHLEHHDIAHGYGPGMFDATMERLLAQVLHDDFDWSLLHFNLGQSMERLGLSNLAQLHFNRTTSISPEHVGGSLRAALHLPRVFESHTQLVNDWCQFDFRLSKLALHVRESRVHTSQCINELSQGFIFSVTNLLQQEMMPNGLALIKVADILNRVCVVLDGALVYNQDQEEESRKHLSMYVVPHLRIPADSEYFKFKPNTRRIRVGVVSHALNRQTEGRMFVGPLTALPRNKFELVLFGWPQRADDDDDVAFRFQRRAGKHNLYSLDSGNLSDARRMIGVANIDILMLVSPLRHLGTFLIGMSRLAPVQVLLHSHRAVGTSFLRGLDYEIVHDAVADMKPLGRTTRSQSRAESNRIDCQSIDDEPESIDPQVHQVVRFGNHSMFQVCIANPPLRNPEAQTLLYATQGMQLFDEVNYYLVFGPLQAMSLEFDEALVTILCTDAAAEVILLVSQFENIWVQKLRTRVYRKMSMLETCTVAGRIKIINRMPYPNFINLLQLVDVVLDPYPASRGYSILDALAVLTPVVTLSATSIPQTITAAASHTLHIEYYTVARNTSDYAAKAIEIAGNKVLQLNVQERVALNRDSLFEDPLKSQCTSTWDEMLVRFVA